MHIKQITISNFRSFRQQSELQPSFSAQTNAVIGRNGSGKSNLFDAVQFCLAAPPRFTNLRPEERQALLHEGSGSAAVNAYVEIVFDNSDQRFASVDSSSSGTGHLPDEVVLRRTVGLKKDEFFLQRKRCTKNEVQSLLEGAGFSKSNPYFIVQQGKVQDLCTMSDHERLALLKEVAGTTTYDDRKAESLAKMQDNQASIDKIAEVLEDIENRLQELQTERQELDAYQTHDKSRRAIEYSLYDQQWRKARTTLDTLEEERAMHLQELRTVHDAAKETHDGIRSIEAQLASQTAALRRHKQGPLALCKEEKQRFQTKTTKLMLQVQEMEEGVTTLDQEWQMNQKELVSVNAKIRHAETLLEDSLEPQKSLADEALSEMIQQRNEAQRKLQGLYAKQGRGRQFASRNERDAFLQTQLDDLEITRNEKQLFLDQQRNVVLMNLRNNIISREEQELNTHLSTVTTRTTALQELTKSLTTQQSMQLELHESRKSAQRITATLQDSVRQARRDVHTATSDFRKCLPRATAQGLAALETLVEQEGLIHGQHYWGIMLENITLKHPKYQTAVEVAAQNSLFHVICDTDETASKLMKRLEHGKLGRVTFLPLNTLRVVDDNNNNNNNHRLPDSLAKTDVCSLLDVCLQYDEKLESAMQHVFGKKLLCRTAELAAEWSTKLQTDAITLDGDLCGRKGALTGGYVDATKSRMRAFAQKTLAQEALQNLQTQLDDAKNKATQVDQEANQLVQEVQRIEAKHAELTFLLQQEEGQVERLQTRLNLHRAQEENLVNTVLPPLERELETLQKDVDNLQEEMKTELAVTLSEQDREMMQQLKEVQTDLAAQIAEQKEVVAQAGLEVQKVKSLLQDNLFKRRDELIAGSSLAQKDNDNGQDDDDDDDDNDDEDDDTAMMMAATPGRRRRQRQMQNSRRRGGGGGGGSQATISAAVLLKQRQEDLQEAQQALDSAMALKEKAEERLEEARDTERELRTALHSAKNELEQLRTKDVQNAKALEEAQDKSERLLTKRSMAMSKRETYARKIQELGSLPPPAELQKYAQLTISQLMKELEKINKQLKKYSHVNKKAYDQYVNFSEQRESLLHRKEQLDSDDIKIKELIESLDRKKDEAINRTFRGVSSHFKDVFNELVPNGSGELIMRTALDEGGSQTDEEKEESSDDSTLSPKKKKAKTAAESQESAASTTGPNINLYRGVGIKVRFSEIGENFMMSQLSGGQKALVALALIFAIQRCDPAPFYLFDELDQALDQTYRSAVANLIQKQANSEENPTQFIVSTFRPELVRVANQCYGISHQNKVSSVHPFQKREALKFISNLMNEEEALGDISKTGGATAAAARKRKSVDQGKRQQQQQQDKDDDASASQEGTTEGGKAAAATSVAEASSKSPLSPATEDSGKDDEEEATSEESTP